MALETVASTDLVTVAPARLSANQLGSTLHSFPLPVPTPEIPAVLAWHARHEQDSAHRWLRATIRQTLTSTTHDRPAAGRSS
jgi:DNA-binding transcriptional LysR family regulator